MPILNYHFRRRSSDTRGAALVIVLLFIMLLSIVVLAFLTRALTERQSSYNSFNQSKVDELARSALDIVTGDLKQEIVNGSTIVTPSPGSTVYPSVYQPIDNAYVIPTQNWPGQPTGGALSTIPNLIRISAPNTIASPAVDHPASAVLSTTTSANGRSVSLARWNQHYLIPCPTNPTDSTPSTACNFTAPSWVYINTNGPTVLTVPAKGVIGRYAYAIYNEGGLLDANVAGYPSNQTPTQSGGKSSSLAYADLTQLTDSAGNACFTSSQVDQLVGWRNYASAQPAGTFPSFNFASSSATNYFNNFAFSTNSFMKVSGYNGLAGTAWQGNTDQALLGRQELLNLQKSIGFSASALQYLGTFSREVNAPTFTYPAAGTAGVGANDPISPSPTAVSNTFPNANILTLHMKKAGTALDGFTWNAGDLLVPRRFSLSRLAWLTCKGPSADLPAGDPLYNVAGTDASIQAFFGLKWDTANSQLQWDFVGPTGATQQAYIETLKQVAAEATSREPNFFELLKAAIHCDSLGISVGNTSTTSWAGNCGIVDGSADLQILRIGANMVDQADADSYPTTIAFMPAPPTPLYAYGIEDLPYVNAIGFRAVADSYLTNNYVDTGAGNHILYDEIVPVLWNPHRTINVAAATQPAKIQLYMTGRTAYVIEGGYQVPASINTSGRIYTATNDTAAYSSDSSAGRINEMGLGNFSLGTAEQDAGSILIDQTQFSSFANPNLILCNPGSGMTSPTGSLNSQGLGYGKRGDLLRSR